MDSFALERLAKEMIKDKSVIGLEIRIDRNSEGKGAVFVGFSKTFEYEIGRERTKVLISEKDLRDLSTGYLSYSQEEGAFLYYPEISLDWENTPKENIQRIISNKSFTSKGADWAGEKNSPTFEPIRKILLRAEVVSIYSKNNMLQIEFIPSHPTGSEEEEISDLILIYLTFLYPALNEPLQNHQ
ncbi:hypothetical protein [Leptospira ilyithenensis]|uniref:Uncharacterized protein n=1 Tax=Leptospira ilyithenensis TaxID=2484901 RepID=A0A4R9LNY3_9LEPT|nr:hypothetical protein [Leptospira ilyithenensis]TGN08389.1 hypothetical protein EHS11_15945 [Leptospira ilyithenensis]